MTVETRIVYGDVNEVQQVAISEMKKFYTEFKTCIDKLNISKIGTPVRWQKKINVINAMNLYNAIVEKSFQYLSVGHLVYCKFSSLQSLRAIDADLPVDKLNAIAIPLKFNKELVDTAFQKYGISFDLERQWNNILNKTCHRILDGLKFASIKKN